MGTLLYIHIKTVDELLSKDIEFFNSENWDVESELQMMQSLHELLSLVRTEARKLQLHMNIEVDDFIGVSNIITKKLKKGYTINTQKLSLREVEVLGLIMKGYTNKQIADKLFISFETVRSHRKHILEKTGSHNTAALVNHYHQTFFDK